MGSTLPTSFGEIRAVPRWRANQTRAPGRVYASRGKSATRCYPSRPFNNRRVSKPDSLAMATSQVLTHLYSIDTSSPEFSRYLYRLIQHDEEEGYLSTLQGPELLKLVDFLDAVLSLPYPSISSLRNELHRLLA